MKGIAAIDALIIVVIGVVAIIAILGLFMGVWTPVGIGTSLEAATQIACKKINPALCKESSLAARTPVFDFDANKDTNSVLNEHDIDPGTGCVEFVGDTFEQLCHHYYGGPPSWVPPNSMEMFIDRCMVQVCGCPKYSIIEYLGGKC